MLFQGCWNYSYYTGEWRSAAHSIRNLKHSAAEEIPKVFHNGSNYDYHFILKELAEGFEGKLTCLGENTKNT